MGIGASVAAALEYIGAGTIATAAGVATDVAVGGYAASKVLGGQDSPSMTQGVISNQNEAPTVADSNDVTIGEDRDKKKKEQGRGTGRQSLMADQNTTTSSNATTKAPQNRAGLGVRV